MKKTILYVSLVLVCVSLVSASNECGRFEIETNIPCELFTTYIPENACNTYSLGIYNDSGNLIRTQTMGTVGATLRCNATFNYTAIGQYHANATTGDTWDLTMEEDTMLFTYRALVYGGYLLAVLILIAFMHKFKEDEGTPIVYGAIASSLSFIMVGVIWSGFNIFNGITFVLDANIYLATLTAGIGVYTGIASIQFWNLEKQKGLQEG